MTKLYNEIKDLDIEDALHILARVGYLDLQREYKLLADHKDIKVVLPSKPKKVESQNYTGLSIDFEKDINKDTK